MFRLRVDLRRRWRAVVGLGLLVAVLGGIVLATFAGARRTASAYDRFLDVANPPELLVSPPGGPGTDPTPFYDAFGRIPGVRGITVFAGVPLLPEAGTPSERLAEALTGIGVIAPIDGTSGSDIGRRGRWPAGCPTSTRADEILVSQRFAASGDLDVGDHIDGVMPDLEADRCDECRQR